MPSRNELEARAAKANVNPASYPNDSKLEQAVIYAESNSVATGAATTLLASTNAKKNHGGANV